MRRNMCAGCCALLMAAALALCFQGCATRNVVRWVNPDNILQVRSTSEIDAEFRTLFSVYNDGSERFSSQQISVGKGRFLFVTAYPYRGRAIYSIYCFEQMGVEGWYLRAIIPVIGARAAVPLFVAEGKAAKVLVDNETIFTLESLAEKTALVRDPTRQH
jgi:hypothetical protein